MAREDWEMGDGDFYDEFIDRPSLNDVLGLSTDESVMDQRAHDLMWDAIVNESDDAYRDLVDYMWEEYGIDFEAEWDWEDWREWYDAQ